MRRFLIKDCQKSFLWKNAEFDYEEHEISDPYHGASMNLENNIVFNFKFKVEKIEGTAKYAIVTYKNVDGEIVTTEEILVTTEVTNKGIELYVVKFDTFLVEDANQLFTCDLYAEDGTLLASEKDGLLNYCARAIKGLDAMLPDNYNSGKTFQIPFYKALAAYLEEVNAYAVATKGENAGKPENDTDAE